MSQEIVQVNSFLRGYHEYVTGRIQKNVLTTQQWKGHSQRETSKESWCRIGLEVPCEYEFESDNFSCWLQRKLEKEKFDVCPGRPTAEKCNGL